MKINFCVETCLKWIKIIFSFGDIYNNIIWWLDPIIVLIVWNCDDSDGDDDRGRPLRWQIRKGDHEAISKAFTIMHL